MKKIGTAIWEAENGMRWKNWYYDLESIRKKIIIRIWMNWTCL